MGQGKDDSKLTIFTYAQNWLDDLAAQGLSANKLKSHQMMLRVLHKYLEHSGKVDKEACAHPTRKSGDKQAGA